MSNRFEGIAQLVGGVYWKMTPQDQQKYDDWCEQSLPDTRDWNIVEEETVLLFRELLDEEELNESLGYGRLLE